MSRQANERREYESYCNRIKLCTNKIEKIKEAFPANHGMTYEQFLKSRLEPQVEQNVASFVEKIEEKVEYETESVAEKKDDDNTNTPLILEETDFD
jgi:flagellar biosynthesis chaperone FliJ